MNAPLADGGDGSRQPFDPRKLIVIFLGYLLGFLVVIGTLSWVVGIGSQGLGSWFALIAAGVVPLVPFLIVMGFSGQLRKVTGGPGGIEILFREAQSTIRPVALEEKVYDVEPHSVEAAVVDYTQYVDEFEDRTVLSFRLGMAPFTEDIDGFLTHMPQLEYVIFTDEWTEFRGLMTAADFRSVYQTNRDAMVERIDSGEVLEIADVVTTTLPMQATNAEALKVMNAEGVDKLGVVDDEEMFYGVITQDGISKEMLLGILPPR